MNFIRKAEFKYKLFLNDKIKEFFECWKLVNDINDVDISKSNFYCDCDLN